MAEVEVVDDVAHVGASALPVAAVGLVVDFEAVGGVLGFEVAGVFDVGWLVVEAAAVGAVDDEFTGFGAHHHTPAFMDRPVVFAAHQRHVFGDGEPTVDPVDYVMGLQEGALVTTRERAAPVAEGLSRSLCEWWVHGC